MHLPRISPTTLFVPLFMAMTFIGAFAEVDGAERNRTLSITGEGTVRAAPDVATINAGVQSDAKTAGEALDQNNDAMSKVIDALKNAGVDAKDLATNQFHVEPRYKHFKDGQPPQVVGYRVTNSLQVTVRELGNLGRMLDEIVRVGSNRINSIHFDISEKESLMNEARKLAVKNARERAQIYADAAGVKLGQVLSITEQTFGAPQPFAGQVVAREFKASVPIETGEQALQVRVNMSFELD